MSGEIRRAVIEKIAKDKRVSWSVAAHIYACQPILKKQRMCSAEEARRRTSTNLEQERSHD